MTIEQIRKAHEAQPFQPFRIVLADGGRVTVPHPEFLAHPGKGRTVIVFDRSGLYRVIDLLLVTSLEIGTNDHRGNGAARRRRRRH
jgi:hypothetical protein